MRSRSATTAPPSCCTTPTSPPTSAPGPFEIVPRYDGATGVAAFSQVIFNRPSAGHWRPDHRVPVAAIGVFRRARPTISSRSTRSPCSERERWWPGAPRRTIASPATTASAAYRTRPRRRSSRRATARTRRAPLGWSIGWGDQYDQTDSGQPIDITGLPNGTYTLRGIVDPEHLLTETSKTNDVTDTVLTITGDSVVVGAQTHPKLPLPSVRITSPSRGRHVHDTVRLTPGPRRRGRT